MPRRDEEKRIAFLRTLSVEDLANRRITEFSSETEKQMIHQARDAMKEKNDERWMRRYKKKAAVDTVKTQMGVVGRRAQTEVFGREGGLTGGMVGSWLLGGTLAGGTIIGIASRGKFGAMAKAAGKFKGGTRAKIADLQALYQQGIITDKHADKVAKLVSKHKSGQAKNFDYDQLDWFHSRYKERAKTLFAGKGGNPVTSSAPPMKQKRALTEDERRIIREHRQKIRGGTTAESKPQAAGGKTADGRPQTAAEVLPTPPPPPPVDTKEILGDALGKLQTARGGKVSLKIERGNTDAFEQLAKDIASVSDQYSDPEQQYKIAQALTQKAAKQNVPPGNQQKLDDYIQALYDKVIDVKKKVSLSVDGAPKPAPIVVPPIDRSLLKEYKQRRRGEDLDRPATRKEVREANEVLALGKDRGNDIDTVQGVQDLRRDILEGRFGATKERKRELGLLSDIEIRPESKEFKTKAKYTKEEFEKYLETARQLDEQQKKRIADAINDVMKEAE